MTGLRTSSLGRRDFLGRLAAIGLGAGAIPGLLPAVAARASSDTTQKRELVVLQWSDLTALDPHAAKYMTDCRVVSNLFDTLVRRHPDGTLHPGLATAWQRTGPTTWHLTLRPDVRWHDGTRFTAIDAKYSLDRTFDPSVKAARLLPLLQTIERTEDARSGNARHPYQAAGRADPGSARRVGSRRPLGVHRSGGVHRVQPAPGGNRAAPLRVVDQGRAMRSRGQPRLLGWTPRPGPRGLSPRARARRRAWTRCSAATRISSRSSRPEHSERVASHPSTRLVGAPYAGLYVLAVNVWVAPLEPPARPAGPLAGRRSGRDREGNLARARPRAERADPPRGQSPRPVAATPPVRPRGGSGSAPPGRLSRRARRPRNDGRVPRE